MIFLNFHFLETINPIIPSNLKEAILNELRDKWKLLNDIETFLNAVIFKEKENKNRLNVISTSNFSLNEKTCLLFSLLANNMDNSKMGLENLKLTYKDDEDTIKKIDKVIIRMEKISEFAKQNMMKLKIKIISFIN